MAINIVNETGHQGVWGIKDPRTLLVLDGWKELLADLSFVGLLCHFSLSLIFFKLQERY
tara:strand:- start:373 stop:549 length:177 start_codon:yes stop_codon:yes gene_type:complete